MKRPIPPPALLSAALFLLLCLLVLMTKASCPLCGGPVYFYLLRFCGHWASLQRRRSWVPRPQNRWPVPQGPPGCF